MISSEAFYENLSRNLPPYLAMASEIVGVEEYPQQEIMQDFGGEGVTALDYSNKNKRLEFHHRKFKKEFLTLKAVYDKFFGNYTLEHHMKALLSHEPMHLMHDLCTGNQFSSQMLDFYEDKEKITINLLNSLNLLLARGVQEAIATYGSKTILQKMGCAYVYNNMELAKTWDSKNCPSRPLQFFSILLKTGKQILT